MHGDEIRYETSVSDVRLEQLSGFFEGWPVAPSPKRHLALLRGSDHVLLARRRDGRVVGFVTANGDGVLSASIPLLEVLPAYRGRGIGSELVRRLLDALADLYMVDLSCDAELEPFYRRFGMVALGGMGIRNQAALR